MRFSPAHLIKLHYCDAVKSAWANLPETKMRPAPNFIVTPLPQLNTVRDLIHFLPIEDVARLNWLADHFQSLHHQVNNPIGHYHYRWQGKKPRLLEIPKAQLKAIQHRIAEDILTKVPTHSAAHGFKQGHSTISYTQPHIRKHWVLHLDLKKFFLTLATLNQSHVT